MPTVNRRGADTKDLFAEFVREALVILFVATLALVWVWTVFVALFDAELNGRRLLALALTVGCGLLLYQLIKSRLQEAVAVYLVCLLAVISLLVAAYG